MEPVADTALRGNATGGTRHQLDCPSGEVLVGFNANYGDALDRVQLVCGRIALTSGTLGYTITVGAGSTLPARGGTGGSSMASPRCPANQMVVGFEGRASGTIYALALRCAPVLVTAQSPGAILVGGTISTLSAVGGSGGTAFPTTDCVGVATGGVLRTGDLVDAFGLRCSRLIVR